jgi:hypothetical protein
MQHSKIYLIIYLFNISINYSDCTAFNGQMVRIWKEAVILQFKSLSRYFPGGTEENHKNHSVNAASLPKFGLHSSRSLITST